MGVYYKQTQFNVFNENKMTSKFNIKTKTKYCTRLAQSVERQPFKLVVVGSSPISGVKKISPHEVDRSYF